MTKREKTVTITLPQLDLNKLCALLDKAGDQLRVLAEYKQGAEGKAAAVELADGCDHWLEIFEPYKESWEGDR